MSTISPHITEFGTVDEEVDAVSMHRYCRSRNYVEKHASAIQSSSLLADAGLDANFRESIQIGLDTVRMNTVPALLAIFSMVILALMYAVFPFFENTLNQIAILKSNLGPAFAFFGMGLTVGFLSEYMKLRRSATRRWTRSNTVNFLFMFMMFGVIATAKDPIYYLLANIYGEGTSFSIILRKVMFDQFAWTLFLVCPAQTFLFAWKAHGFSGKSLRAECPSFSEFFALKIMPALIINWSYWLPASAIIFCFPTELQLAVSIMAVSIWIISLNCFAPSYRSIHLAGK
ncbi:hypothetical protein SH580_15075 [Coraliomargarita algicola]|uniref:Uncharacterized protein n=1 Tax=Coraliomargarita algicola TaxID=3092156 RepID=A0ABZ0RF16_9BACT|nr:hypothetical protein [Coraliomargarita sp. J2-16]WPJ94754.1 hypothetical protein SH580_15075 [Coraliomargarita sp. J2-16]